MEPVNFKKTLEGTVAELVAELTERLKEEGFGIMTRIDFHAKIKAQLGKDLPETVILGACNPALAYEAYMSNTDASALMPCNAVVRDLGGGRVCVELAKPSVLMSVLRDKGLERPAREADQRLKRALDRLRPAPSASRRAAVKEIL